MLHIKHHRLKHVLLLCIFTLAGCSKIEHTDNCVPSLEYTLPEDTEFVLIEMNENIGDFIRNNDLQPWLITEMKHKNIPKNIDEGIVPFHAGRFILTGVVLEYQKSPLASFDSSGIFFNVKTDSHTGWMSGETLYLISKHYFIGNNQKNQMRFVNGFGEHGRFECIEKN